MFTVQWEEILSFSVRCIYIYICLCLGHFVYGTPCQPPQAHGAQKEATHIRIKNRLGRDGAPTKMGSCQFLVNVYQSISVLLCSNINRTLVVVARGTSLDLI